ncbi:MAG: hypothetical protein V3U24_10120 [Candidatus Neomarinimicrobiota bacterium]
MKVIRQQAIGVCLRNRRDIQLVFFEEVAVVTVRKEKLFIADCSIVKVVSAIVGKRGELIYHGCRQSVELIK